MTNSGASSLNYEKAINAVHISSVFLKHLIENAKSDRIEELYLSLNDGESASKDFLGGKTFLEPYFSFIHCKMGVDNFTNLLSTSSNRSNFLCA